MKYADLHASFQFQPIAMETLRPISDSATDFLDRLGQMISANPPKQMKSEKECKLYQRISITIQRFNETFFYSNDLDL